MHRITILKYNKYRSVCDAWTILKTNMFGPFINSLSTRADDY